MLTFNSTTKPEKKQISLKSQLTFFEANCLGKKPDSRKLASKKPTWQPWSWEEEYGALPNSIGFAS